MAIRKDSKGRFLRRGETQRKDGRYCYKYVDAKGRTRCVYSWTLTTRDLTPKGKKAGACLRELEKGIQRDLFDKVAPDDMTVYDLALRYTETKTAVKQTTRAGYKTVLNYLAKDEFGSRRIRTSRLSRPRDGSSTSKTSTGSATAPFTQYAGS